MLNFRITSVLTLTFLLGLVTLEAQTPSDALEEFKLGAYLQLGMQQSTVPASDVYFGYVDESPSRDNIQRNFAIRKSSMGVAFRLGAYVDWKKARFLLGYDGVFSSVSVNGFEFGMGYKLLDKEKFKLVPMLTMLAGQSSIKLGDIDNNDVYIQVNDVKFYSETALVRLKSNFFTFRPGVQLAVPLTHKISITGGLNYNLVLSNGKQTSLNFSGEDESGQSVNEDEVITANNVDLWINGSQQVGPLARPRGLGLVVGVLVELR